MNTVATFLGDSEKIIGFLAKGIWGDLRFAIREFAYSYPAKYPGALAYHAPLWRGPYCNSATNQGGVYASFLVTLITYVGLAIVDTSGARWKRRVVFFCTASSFSKSEFTHRTRISPTVIRGGKFAADQIIRRIHRGNSLSAIEMEEFATE